MINVLASSSDDFIRSLFQLPLTKIGKVNFCEDETETENIDAQENFSQMASQQTLAIQFLHWVDNLLESIISSDIHHIFCFDRNKEMTDQIEIFNIKEFTFVRRNGYSHRLDFSDFLAQYCFLAFEFDERVVATKKTAQLLMLRLGIDGFFCGKRKIFLKYYHMEFLSDLYDKQYKRIVTVQAAARRYLAIKKAEREKCSKVAKTFMLTRKAGFKWKSYKSAANKIAAKSMQKVYGKKFNTLQKDKAATDIQRHLRGYNVRKKLSKQVRMKLVKILYSPAVNRKSQAENVLLGEGLSESEAQKAVEEMEDAVKQKDKESIITKNEAISLFPEMVHQLNFVMAKVMRKTRDNVDIELIPEKKLSYVLMEPNVMLPAREKNIFLPPANIFDISSFYTDEGPAENWDHLVENKSKSFTTTQVSNTGHVIKERTKEKPPERTKLINDSKPYQLGSNGSKPDVKYPPKPDVKNPSKHDVKNSPKKKHFPPKPQTKNVTQPPSKVQPKWPVVQPSHVLKGKTNQDSARLLLDQLNTMKKSIEASTEAEVEGPFNFKMLLRKTNQLPTDTLRRRRNGTGEPCKETEFMKICRNSK